NGEQVPWMSSSLAEDISFGRPSAVAATSAPAPATAQPALPSPPVVNSSPDGVKDCDNARQDGTKKAWTDYLAKYPTGSCAQFARDQLAKIEQAPQVKPQLSNQQNEDRELSDLNRRLQQNPKDSDAFYRRGQAYAKRGNYSGAIDDF